MTLQPTKVLLENGLDLNDLVTTGSVINISHDFAHEEYIEPTTTRFNEDFFAQPVESFEEFGRAMTAVDPDGYVKKKIFEEGGGLPLHHGCTVSIAYNGFWENEEEPFDVRKSNKPLVVDLKDSGLLPGLQIAVESMLVGEMSAFLLSYKVMYGELGVLTRIKPKADCVFFIKLLRSILTPEGGAINYSEPNMFERLIHEVRLLLASGSALFKTNNYKAAIDLFNKATYMLHKCHLADEKEEKIQEKYLIKLYINLAICNNAIKKPLKACIACNELNRLNSLWNNSKALYQNAIALRMIGAFDNAEKKLLRAIKLKPDQKELKIELDLLNHTHDICNQNKLYTKTVLAPSLELISDDFKKEVDKLISSFKEDFNLNKLILPMHLTTLELKYIRETCVRENLFCNKIQNKYALDKDTEIQSCDKEFADLLGDENENKEETCD